tara:strand:+ start:193 stop:375 length:183 start_codon:yes stop_codon:yes gene_type:complete
MTKIIKLKDMDPIRTQKGCLTGAYYWTEPVREILVDKRGIIKMQLLFAPIILAIAFYLGA